MSNFKNLVESSAYLIWRAHEGGTDSQLGKTKLYKMLFMAAWWAHLGGAASLYNGPWYRIDKGPALTPADWDLLTAGLKSSHSISSDLRAMWHGHAQVVFGNPKQAPGSLRGSELVTYLNEAFERIIGITANDAAKLTYETEPMKWIVAEERALWDASTQYRQFRLDNPERAAFVKLAEQYSGGLIDVPEIARAMGEGWTLHRVAVYLDTFGYFRSPEQARLSDSARENILAGIMDQVNSKSAASDPAEDRAVASSRIEQEFVTPESIID